MPASVPVAVARWPTLPGWPGKVATGYSKLGIGCHAHSIGGAGTVWCPPAFAGFGLGPDPLQVSRPNEVWHMDSVLQHHVCVAAAETDRTQVSLFHPPTYADVRQHAVTQAGLMTNAQEVIEAFL